MAALAHVKDLRLTLGGAPLFEGVEFVLHKGERAAFVGANGAGKSTLMRVLAGLAEADAGEVAYASGTVVAFAPQEVATQGYETLRAFAAAPTASAGSGLAAARHAVEAALTTFSLDPDGALEGLSGGALKRASLARAFAAAPDLLLLDEPTNHLDIAAIEELEDRLQGFRGASLIISHDRRFLERISTSTLWLRRRRVIKLDRGFSQFEEWAQQIEQEDERAEARLETHLKAEEHWLRRGVTARRARNEGRRRKLEALRAQRRTIKATATGRSAALTAERGAESARLVIEAKDLSKAYGAAPVVAGLSLRVMRADRVGVVGPNGAGKSTLLELLLRRREPDAGMVRLGEGLQIAYVDQARSLLDAHATVWDALAPQGGDQIIVRGRARHIAAYAEDFLFRREQLRQPVAALSGGERNRLALAIVLAQPANLLVLDEPTNDLDMDTLELLEDMLASYDGTVLVVSHDRAFLDGVATQILGPLGAGRWAETPGGWTDFEREHGPARRPRAASSGNVATPLPPRTANKLSYKEERRAAELDALLDRLASEIIALESGLSDPRTFAENAAAYNAAAARLGAARSERDAAENEWLEIELRREALAGRS